MKVKNNGLDFSPYASTGAKSPKIFLICCLAVSVALDLCITVALGVMGINVKFWIIPMLTAVFGALFIAGACLSNFRFTYTVAQLVFYVLITSACTAAQIFICISGETTALEDLYALAWIVSHAVIVVCVIITYLHASKRVAGNWTLQTVLAVIFAAVTLVSSGYYALIVFYDGFFGQGGFGTRPVEFSYNEETDSYTAESVMAGKGKTVEIPYTFNGKQVTGVNCDIFNTAGIELIKFSAAEEVEFINVAALRDYEGSVKVEADVDKADTLRNKFYGYNEKLNTNKVFALANSIYPALEDGKVYLSFNYDEESYSIAKGKVLPVWKGEKGENFNLDTYASDYNYVKYRNSLNDGDLHNAYTLYDGYILSELAVDGSAVNGKQVDENISVDIKFDKIYRVNVEEDNDDVYEASITYKNSIVNGTALGFKYCTVANADAYTGNLVRRGFDIEWQFLVAGSWSPLNSLSSTLSNRKSDDITIRPVWSMQMPKFLNVTTNVHNNTLIYGEDLTLFANSESADNDFLLSYKWTKDGESFSGKNWEIDNVPYSAGGQYKVEVTSYSKSHSSSLTAKATATIDVTVKKRPLDVTWTGDWGNSVSWNSAQASVQYDGLAKTVSCKIEINQNGQSKGVINGDEVNISLGERTFTNAGSHPVTARLIGKDATKYEIDGSNKTNLVITPAPLNITWSDTSFVYSGKKCEPKPQVTGVIGADDISLAVYGGSVNAGSYEARAVVGNANYRVDGGEKVAFTIERAPVEITWEEADFVYEGYVQMPAVRTVIGAVNGESLSPSVYTSNGITAGNHTATATLNSGNYKIEKGETCSYEIAKREITINWLNTSLVYTGNTQVPEYALTNTVQGDRGIVNITGGQRDTNEFTGTLNYKATAVVADRNYVFAAGATAEKSYTIARKAVTVIWGDGEFVYNRSQQQPSATLSGVCYGDSVKVNVSGGRVDTGDGTAVASIENLNYVISSNATRQFYIAPKPVTVSWSNTVVEFNGNYQTPKATVNGIIDGDNAMLSVTGGGVDAGSYTVTATLGNTNYRLESGDKCTFVINSVTQKVSNNVAALPSKEVRV